MADLLPDGSVVEESDDDAGLALRPPQGTCSGRRVLRTAAAAAVVLSGAAAAAGWAWRSSTARPRGAAHGASARRVALQQAPRGAAGAAEAPPGLGQQRAYAGYEEDLERYNSLFNGDPEREVDIRQAGWGPGAEEPRASPAGSSTGGGFPGWQGAPKVTDEAALDDNAGYAFANPAPTPEFPELLPTPSPALAWWSSGGAGSGAPAGAPAAAPEYAAASASVPHNESDYARYRYPAAAAGTTLAALATSSSPPAYAAVAPAFPTITATAIPTTTTETSSTTTLPRSLFCFALMMPSGDEVSLMRELLRKS